MGYAFTGVKPLVSYLCVIKPEVFVLLYSFYISKLAVAWLISFTIGILAPAETTAPELPSPELYAEFPLLPPLWAPPLVLFMPLCVWNLPLPPVELALDSAAKKDLGFELAALVVPAPTFFLSSLKEASAGNELIPDKLYVLLTINP
jgi:hypothetical protein